MDKKISRPLLAGFFGGMLISGLLKALLLPTTFINPSSTEQRRAYLTDLQTTGFRFRSLLNQYQSDVNEDVSEQEYLQTHSLIACFFSDADTSNANNIKYIIKSWAQRCDRTFMIYTQPQLLKDLEKVLTSSHNVVPVYVDSHNNTMRAFLEFVSQSIQFQWIIYVPKQVFLIPDNLRYYLYAAKEDSSKIIFFYKSFYQTLLGYWKLGDDSPLVISHGAAAHILTRKCAHSQLLDIGCIIEESHRGMIKDLLDIQGNSLFTVQPRAVSRAPDKLTGARFPVSIYTNRFRNYADLSWYIFHLSTYGITPITGSLTKEPQR